MTEETYPTADSIADPNAPVNEDEEASEGTAKETFGNTSVDADAAALDSDETDDVSDESVIPDHTATEAVVDATDTEAAATGEYVEGNPDYKG